MIDVSHKDTAGERRAVRFTFTLNGVLGREDIVVSAGSEAGAVALAGIAFGQAFFYHELVERAEYDERGEEQPPIAFYLKTVEVGTATPIQNWERVREVMRAHGALLEDDSGPESETPR
jgi:hypothetical protein